MAIIRRNKSLPPQDVDTIEIGTRNTLILPRILSDKILNKNDVTNKFFPTVDHYYWLKSLDTGSTQSIFNNSSYCFKANDIVQILIFPEVEILLLPYISLTQLKFCSSRS